MLTPFLATEDPYRTAAVFCRAGWQLEFETPPDSGDPLSCVSLAGSKVLLAHRAVDPSASALEDRPWGERAFHTTLGGYRFLIASPLSDAAEADPTA